MDHDQEPFSSPPDEPDQEIPPHPDSPPPPEIAELAGVAMDYVRRAVGFDLDLTADTLPVLDHYVALTRESLQVRPELLDVVAPAVGAYFGEVVRSELPSFWNIRGPDPTQHYLCATPVFLAINPLGIAYDVLTCGGGVEDAPSSELLLLPGERESVAERLRALPPAADKEYYLLSTRLEVLQIAAEALRSRRLAHHDEHDEHHEHHELAAYGPADYDRWIGMDGRVIE